MRRISLGIIGLLLLTRAAYAQNGMPRPEGEPVDSTEYNIPRIAVGEPRWSTLDQAYSSRTLRGVFLAQWMYIQQNGRTVLFWGARILQLEADSPLRALGVRPGDVITRLDGIPIWRGMYREQGGPWQIVELEQHFGMTETRFIIRGTQQVRVGQMNLDTYPDDPMPLPP
jgi:hypothetical protein